MSIQSEITRLSGNVSDAFDAIEIKGVTIPSGSNSDDLADLILQIPSSSGSGAITIVDTPDSHGGVVREIIGVNISDTTAVAADVAQGKYFYTAGGTKTMGTATVPNDFVITLSWDTTEQMWLPDKTFNQIQAAAQHNYDIGIFADYGETMTWFEYFDEGEDSFFLYYVAVVSNGATNLKVYTYNGNGVNLVNESNSYDISDTTAIASDVAQGKYFYTANGTKTAGTASGGITPTGNINITQAGVTDVTNYVTATVPSASPYTNFYNNHFYTENNQRMWSITSVCEVDVGEGDVEGWLPNGFRQTGDYAVSAVPANTTITPSTSAQTVGGANYMMEGAVTVSAMPSGTAGTPTATKGTVSNHSVSVTPSVTNTTGYITGSTKTGTAVTVSASELVSGTYTVDSSGTKDVTNYASASVPSGTAGTPSATKGTVSNHSVSVTPSVTNTTGWITGSTKTGTAVTVSASELVSGSQTINQNGTVDVTNLAEIVVAVEGGSGSEIAVGRKTTTLASTASSIQFTGLSGNPTSFAITSAGDVATNTNGVTMVVFDGSSLHGQIVTTQVEASTAFTKSYSNGTLTVTASSASFQAVQYKLVYTYGGTSSDIHTSDVQVGSGATSITFSGLSGNPTYWSCIFKSDFSTSSGYQRVIGVVNDGSSVYGMDMDSSAHAATLWTATYSGGSLTISSQGTNQGGYFHQPGYYQLTYAVDDSAPQYQSKTVSPSTSQQVVEPDSGYDALSSVTVNAMPAMTLPTAASSTSSGTSKATITPTSSAQYLNIPTGYNATAQYYTIAASGGGTSKNTQVVQGTTRTTSSSMTAIGAEMTVSKTGTYDVYWSAFRSNTSSSYTFATQLYIEGTAYESQITTWTYHMQNVHLSNISLTANQKIRVYGRNSRGSSYYVYAPTLVIVES